MPALYTYCLGCGIFFKAKTGDLLLCAGCFSGLPRFPENVCVFSGGSRETGYIEKIMGFDDMYALYFYDGLTADLMQRYKYQRDFYAMRTLRALIRERLVNIPFIKGYDFSVTVPSHFFSLLIRGYNPAAMLFKGLTSLDDAGYMLKKKRYLPPTASLKGSARRKQLKQRIYQVKKQARATLKGKSVIIFDDVMTTGTTLRSTAKALRQAGVTRVGAVIFARNMRAI